MAEYRSGRWTVERHEINTCSLGTMRAHHKFGAMLVDVAGSRQVAKRRHLAYGHYEAGAQDP